MRTRPERVESMKRMRLCRASRRGTCASLDMTCDGAKQGLTSHMPQAHMSHLTWGHSHRRTEEVSWRYQCGLWLCVRSHVCVRAVEPSVGIMSATRTRATHACSARPPLHTSAHALCARRVVRIPWEEAIPHRAVVGWAIQRAQVSGGWTCAVATGQEGLPQRRIPPFSARLPQCPRCWSSFSRHGAWATSRELLHAAQTT